jgi:predicted ATPase
VTFVIGENGSGKSTLLEAIAIAWGFNPEGGTKNFRFQTRGSHSSLHAQSHGESFFALMMHRFGGHGFYVLDGPEAALSPSRQLAMISRMHELVQQRSRFVIATHSPMLMAYPDAWIYQITSEGLVRTEYRQTEHYLVARRFLMKGRRSCDGCLVAELPSALRNFAKPIIARLQTRT